MLNELRLLVKSIQKGTFQSAPSGASGIASKFRQICDPKTFAEVLFPGAPASELETKPASLRDLLLWPELVIDVTHTCKSAASIFDTVLQKGTSMGDSMDVQTRSILIPQIVQEALARELVTAVRNLNKNLSKVATKLGISVANKDAPQADWDMLDEDVVDLLYKDSIAVQEEYLGDEWAQLVLDYVQRFSAYEKMTDVRNKTRIVALEWI